MHGDLGWRMCALGAGVGRRARVASAVLPLLLPLVWLPHQTHSNRWRAPPLARLQEVNERLQTASETRRKITEACEEYRPVARRATLLYFLIAEFAGVNCMYQVKRLGSRRQIWQLRAEGNSEVLGRAVEAAPLLDCLTPSSPAGWYASSFVPLGCCSSLNCVLAPLHVDLAGPICGAVRAVHRPQ